MEQGITITQAARELRIRPQRLLAWEDMKIIEPLLHRRGRRVTRIYTPATVARIRKLILLLDEGYRLQRAVRILDSYAPESPREGGALCP